MWENQKIEEIAHKRLRKQFGKSLGDTKYGEYTDARHKLVEEILPDIKAKAPFLTDHGPSHVADVLKRIYDLLGDASTSLTGLDLYCLILSALYHDTGNFYDRKDHQHRINPIYDYIRPDRERYRSEKYIVLKAVEAHCGTASDGSKDTLKLVEPDSPIGRDPVRLRDIAAIIRLADELAEGAHRTSLFMHHQHAYPLENEPFHTYSKITTIVVDRASGRIALTYDIAVRTDASGKLPIGEEARLRSLLKFVYHRIGKLNQERQYARFYCSLLEPFKTTTVALKFWINDELVDLGLGQVVLTDLVVPEDVCKSLDQHNTAYAPDALVDGIKRVAMAKGDA